MVGPARDSESQETHDRVIRRIALSTVDLEKYRASFNRGRDGYFPVRCLVLDGALCPDLVIMNRRTGRVQAVYEVETEESVNDEHARLEWKPYSALGRKFTLVVPRSKLTNALELVEKHKIPVEHIGTHEVNSLGKITLDFPGFT